MRIDRRAFMAGVGAALVGAGCGRSEGREAPGRKPPDEPKTPGAREVLGPGFSVNLDPPTFGFAGDTLVVLQGLSLLVGAVKVADVRSFAILADGSVIAYVETSPKPYAVHLVGGREVARHELYATRVLATESADAYWALGAGSVQRIEVATGKVQRKEKLPDSTKLMGAATAADGALVAPAEGAIVRFQTALESFAMPGAPDVLAPASGGRLWGANRYDIPLLELRRAQAVAVGTQHRRAGETITRFSASGDRAAALMARSVGPEHAVYELACFTPAGEAWRVPFPDRGAPGQILVTPAFLAAYYGDAGVKKLDLATGRPI